MSIYLMKPVEGYRDNLSIYQIEQNEFSWHNVNLYKWRVLCWLCSVEVQQLNFK